MMPVRTSVAPTNWNRLRDSPSHNQATIKAVATSTMGVLKKLRGLVAKAKEEGTGLPDQLEAHGVVGYTAAFLLDLASAENLA